MGLKEMWAEARYRKRVGAWARECALADDQYERARRADAGMFTSDRARLEPGERLCGEFNAGLSETRRVRVTNYGSVSHQTHSGNRVRAGQARSTSIDELQVIDSGTVVITDRRVQFLGARHNRELRWRNLADNPQVGKGSMTFRSAGRQKPLVFTFHPSGTERVSFDVDLALALFDGAGSSNVQRLADRLEQLKTHPPQRPPGIELDERVAALAPIKQVAALAAPPTITRPALHLPHGCFIHTGPEEVAVSAAALGFTAKLLTWPGSDAKLAASGPVIHDIPLSAHTTALGVELSVVSGDVDQVWAILDATRPRHSVVVSASALEGIETLDGPGS